MELAGNFYERTDSVNLPSRVVSGHFDEISCRRFESPDGVLRVPRGDVVGHHHVLGHHVSAILDDEVEDRTAAGAERVQLDRHGRLVQVQQLRRMWYVRLCR